MRTAMKWKNVFILLGIALELIAAATTALGLISYRRDRRIVETYDPAPAVVVAHGIRQVTQTFGRSSRKGYAYSVTYRYAAGGREYESSQLIPGGVWFDALPTEEEARAKVAAMHPIGQKGTAYYDPNNPSDAVLERPTPSLGGLICPAGFALLGVPGCAYGLLEWRRRRSRPAGEGAG